jgi:hypothetical protein
MSTQNKKPSSSSSSSSSAAGNVPRFSEGGGTKKLHHRNKTGFNGVSKKGERFRARLKMKNKETSLGTYATAKEAAIAFDKGVRDYGLNKSRLNYPNGLPESDVDYQNIMNPAVKSQLDPRNTSGFRGVSKNGAGRFCAKTQVKKKVHRLGTFDTAKAAAIAYDRAISDHGMPKEKLNFPNGFPKDDPDYDKIMNDDGTLKRAVKVPKPAKTAGVGGKRKKRYTAKIGIEKKRIALGTYDTQKEAKLAYDAAVLKHNLSKDRLNYPNGLPKDDPDYERLKDFKPKTMGPYKKRKFANKKDSSSSSSSSSNAAPKPVPAAVVPAVPAVPAANQYVKKSLKEDL